MSSLVTACSENVRARYVVATHMHGNVYSDQWVLRTQHRRMELWYGAEMALCVLGLWGFAVKKTTSKNGLWLKSRASYESYNPK